jgi:hypothetical protein
MLVVEELRGTPETERTLIQMEDKDLMKGNDA